MKEQDKLTMLREIKEFLPLLYSTQMTNIETNKVIASGDDVPVKTIKCKSHNSNREVFNYYKSVSRLIE